MASVWLTNLYLTTTSPGGADLVTPSSFFAEKQFSLGLPLPAPGSCGPRILRCCASVYYCGDFYGVDGEEEETVGRHIQPKPARGSRGPARNGQRLEGAS